ncbi:MAG: hypothetical protein WD490_01540 [Opitutales bacterium]
MELKLGRILLQASKKKGNAVHAAVITLISPRPGINDRTAVRVLPFAQGTADFTSVPFHQKILFKEIIEGPFGIRIEITEERKPEQLERFLRDMASSAIQAAGQYAALEASPWIRSFVRRPFASLSAELFDEDDFLSVLAKGGVDLHSSKLAANYPLRVPLSAPEEIDTSPLPPLQRRAGRPALRKHFAPPEAIAPDPNLGEAILDLSILKR